MRVATVAALVSLMLGGASDCGGPDAGGATEPEPGAQQPAPNADPTPSGGRRHYVKFGVDQTILRRFDWGWSYGDVAPPTRERYALSADAEFDTTAPGIAKVSVLALENEGMRMRCWILYRSDPSQDWQMVAEAFGTEQCEATAVIQ